MKKINTYIIPVLNNYKGLYRLLETLEKYTPPNYNVIVINNGFYLDQLSTDDSVFRGKSKLMTDVWIDSYRNLGFGKSMNIGIKLRPIALCNK